MTTNTNSSTMSLLWCFLCLVALPIGVNFFIYYMMYAQTRMNVCIGF